IATVETALVGCWLKASLVAAAGVMLIGLVVALVQLVTVSVRVNVRVAGEIGRVPCGATPPEALAVTVPGRVPPPGLMPMAIVIEAVLPVTVLPKLSCTVAVSAGLMATVETALFGCWLKASLVAPATATLIGSVVPVIPLDTVSVPVTVRVPV